MAIGPSQKPLSERIKQVEGQISQKESDIQRKQQELDGLATDVRTQTSALPKVKSWFGRFVQFIRTSPRLNFLQAFLFKKSETFRREILAQKLNQAEHQHINKIWIDTQTSIHKDQEALRNEQIPLRIELDQLKNQQKALAALVPALFESANDYLALPELDVSTIDNIDHLKEIYPYKMTAPIMRFTLRDNTIGFVIRGSNVQEVGSKPKIQVFCQNVYLPRNWDTLSDTLISFRGFNVLTDGSSIQGNNSYVLELKKLLKNKSPSYQFPIRDSEGFVPKSYSLTRIKLINQDEMPKQPIPLKPEEEFPDF